MGGKGFTPDFVRGRPLLLARTNQSQPTQTIMKTRPSVYP